MEQAIELLRKKADEKDRLGLKAESNALRYASAVLRKERDENIVLACRGGAGSVAC